MDAKILEQMELAGVQEVVAIHRAKLQEILYSALPKEIVHFGCAYQQHESRANKVLIQFANGTSVETDILLGADGIHSPLRQQLFEQTSLRYTGQTCWRGVAHISLPLELQNKMQES